MGIRLAIQGESSTYSKRWIEYCRDNEVDHEVVDCYASDIIDKLRGFDGLLWNFNHRNPTDLLMARHVLTSAEKMGLMVFPDGATCWHFDDKVAQKYLLEAIGAPLVPTYVFYDERRALEWLEDATYPMVRKLRRGAGSYNVGLVHDYGEAKSFCKQAFGKGFSAIPSHFVDMRTRMKKIHGLDGFIRKLKALPEKMSSTRRKRKGMQREKGYVLFQEFIADNKFDTRISVVGNRAWGFIRGVREHDFRASGSGVIDYDVSKIDMQCVKIAYQVSDRMKTQSLCFDFVRRADDHPLIVEISYGYVPEAIYACKGYWDRDLQWHEARIWPEHAMIEDLLVVIGGRQEGEAHTPDRRDEQL